MFAPYKGKVRDLVGEELFKWPLAAFHSESAAPEVGSVELQSFCLFNASWILLFWGNQHISIHNYVID